MHTLSLGPLVLVATQDGPLLRVSVSTPTTVDAGTLCLTIPEWSSLAAVADVLAAGERRHAEDQQTIDELMGPHCDRCGNPVDPDTCHCGSAISDHGYGDGHAAVPMGCVCGYHDEDFARLAKTRGELLWLQRHTLAKARAEIDVLRQECRELTAQRDAACSALALRERMEGGHG